MLDGNARLNLATFVTTWMEPQARALMDECLDKNMIDKDEYPQTAALEMRCTNILAHLWHAPEAERATGCSTTGSSEAAMLAGLALKRRWQHARRAAGNPADRPNLVMGINVQVCWEKFANYWDVEMRLVPMEGERYHLSAEEAVELCDENTIGVVAVLGSTFDGSYEPVQEICAALDDLQERTGLDVPVHVDGSFRGVRRAVPRPRPRLGLPASARRVDQRLGTQVRARVPGRRLDRLARRGRAARRPDLPRQLPRRRHADLRAQLLAPWRPGRRPVLQLPPPRLRGIPAGAEHRAGGGDAARRRDRATRRRSGCSPAARSCRCSHSRVDDEIDNFNVFDVSRALRERGWLVPAYTFPENRTDLAVLRIVVRQDFSHDVADLLIHDLERQLPRLQAQAAPVQTTDAARVPPLMKAVLVGYDDSPAAGRALDRAIVEARDGGAKLIVVAVEELPLDPTGLQNFGSLDYSPPDATALGPPADIQSLLSRARTVIEAAGLDAEYVWAAGSAASTIVDAARDNGADLIVLGEHHHSFLGRMLGSDVAAEVERRAGARVVSVP